MTCTKLRLRCAFKHTISVLLLTLLAIGAATAATVSKDEQRARLQAQSTQVLADLYAVRPEAREAIASAAGYATFRNLGLKLGVAGSGKGKGLVHDNRSKTTTYMRFLEVQAGLGAGIKRYDLVFVFADAKALEDFVQNGWQYGGQSTVAAKGKAAGKALQGAIAVAPGVWLYQRTERGLAAELTIKGSKYFKDKGLN